MSEENKNPIRTPVKYSQESRMVLDANGDMVCHFMWNTHRPHWDKVGATAQIICALINADYSRVTALESENFAQSDLIEKLQSKNAILEDALNFYGIEYLEDGTTSFKPSIMEKWRKWRNETENAELRAEVAKWKRLAGKKAI